MNDDQQTDRLDELVPPALVADTVPPIEALTVDEASDAPSTSAGPGPRTRWAGIVWGLVLGALAAAGIWLAAGEGRIDDLVAWTQTLTSAMVVGYAVLAIGALVLVLGLVGLLRRAQRTVAAGRSAV